MYLLIGLILFISYTTVLKFPSFAMFLINYEKSRQFIHIYMYIFDHIRLKFR